MAIRFGDVVFDSELRRLTRGGETIHVSPKAFQLLEALLQQRPRPVSKQFITELLWPDVIVEEANIRNLVAEIRDAIGDRGPDPVIRTLPRFGYAFAAEAQDTGTRSRPAGEHPRLIGLYRDYHLTAEENVIGRDSDCDIAIPDPLVSRRHALVRVTDGRATIEDLGSRNGTLVNGTKIESPFELGDGDTVEIGPIRLTFRLVDPKRETEPMIRT